MSFKNLRSPASNDPTPSKEKVVDIPVPDDPSTNGDAINTSPDREGLLRWPEAQFDVDNPASGGNRPPMKLKP